MRKVWVCSDHHLGHVGIITFTDCSGQVIRKFKTIEEHDTTIITRHNELVAPNDRVYFLGDVAINRRCIQMVEKMNGRKVLIKGNHDIFRLKDYVPYFEDIRAYKIFPTKGVILSHIPVHREQLTGRFGINVHGHTHANIMTRWNGVDKVWEKDPCYINVCMEKTNYKPVELEQLLYGDNK